jgi:hypothetical protein
MRYISVYSSNRIITSNFSEYTVKSFVGQHKNIKYVSKIIKYHIYLEN